MATCAECGEHLLWMRTRCPNCGFRRSSVWPFLLKAVVYFLVAFLLTRVGLGLLTET